VSAVHSFAPPLSTCNSRNLVAPAAARPGSVFTRVEQIDQNDPAQMGDGQPARNEWRNPGLILSWIAPGAQFEGRHKMPMRTADEPKNHNWAH